jgi:hypothetical protein
LHSTYLQTPAIVPGTVPSTGTNERVFPGSSSSASSLPEAGPLHSVIGNDCLFALCHQPWDNPHLY